MKTNSLATGPLRLSFGATNLIAIALTILAALLIFGVFTGRKIPMISGDRAALGILFVIGFAMCAMGMFRISATGQWAHPLTIVGYILGALIMLVAAAGYFGFRFAFISEPRDAIFGVGVLMAAKLILSIVHISI